MKSRTGMTLIETMIAASLFAVVAGVALLLLNSALQAHCLGQALAAVQADTLVGVQRLVAEAEESKPGWILNNTSQTTPILALPTARDTNNAMQFSGDGRPDWQWWRLW